VPAVPDHRPAASAARQPSTGQPSGPGQPLVRPCADQVWFADWPFRPGSRVSIVSRLRPRPQDHGCRPDQPFQRPRRQAPSGLHRRVHRVHAATHARIASGGCPVPRWHPCPLAESITWTTERYRDQLPDHFANERSRRRYFPVPQWAGQGQAAAVRAVAAGRTVAVAVLAGPRSRGNAGHGAVGLPDSTAHRRTRSR
jgi:hypothetical protein